MVVECIITREIFKNPENGYRVIGCVPTKDPPPELELNQYGNFTINGSNLDKYLVNGIYEFEIEPMENSKYTGSYVISGIPGIKSLGENITVDPNKEFNILTRYMEKSQAERCLEAYPNFVQMILNNKESEINTKNIYNVGEKRLASYIKKIKEDCRTILFYAVTSKYSITSDENIKTIITLYDSPNQFEQNIKINPYSIYCQELHWSFEKADTVVLEIWPDKIDSEDRCTYLIYDILKQNESEGSTKIYANIMARLAIDIAPEIKKHILKVTKENELFYFDEATKYVSLAVTYKQEKNISDNILYRLSSKNYDSNSIHNWNDYKTFDGVDLTEEQLSVLKTAVNNNVMMLIGPAGSGKSQTTKALIKLLENNNLTYTLLAPTGIAAKRIREYTGRYASTIHMFLIKPEEYGDYLIIDEMSMVGVELLSELLDTIPKETKIIFICDAAQLASISAGNIVQDIINSNAVPIVKLTKVFRYGIGGISTIATDFRQGNLEHLTDTFDDYHFYTISPNPIEQIVSVYQSYLDLGYSKNDIMILCPMNIGKSGTYAINNAIQEKYNGSKDRIAVSHNNTKIFFGKDDKMLNVKNNYQMPVLDYDEYGVLEEIDSAPIMNGDIGNVVEIESSDQANKIYANFNGNIILFELSDLKNILLGYCITIHKSQGSQNKIIIAYIPKCNMITRNLLYVAASRAQKELIIISESEIIEESLDVQENNERETWLENLLTGKENKQ